MKQTLEPQRSLSVRRRMQSTENDKHVSKEGTKLGPTDLKPHTMVKAIKSDPLRKRFPRPPPKLPFCEEYDGMNMRKTSTISQSITELMAIQKKKRQEEKLARLENDLYETSTLDSVADHTDITNLSSSFEFDDIPTATDSGISTNFESGGLGLGSSVDPFEDLHIRRVLKEDVCTVDLELTFLSTSNQLALCVVQAEDVNDTKSPNKLIDTFVKVSMFHRKKNKKQKSNVVRQSRDPVFMQTFYLDNVIEKWMHLMCLRVQLYEKKRFWNSCIGETLIWLEDLDDLVSGEQVSVTEGLAKPYL